MDALGLEGLRRYLFSIAYRMLGTASDAEDIVQEAFLRFHASAEDGIRSPKAYLSTIVTRLCLDLLKSARVARESYHGPWLPEPVPTADLEPAPVELAERREAVSQAFLLLLERLTPEERATYVLREAFDFPYDEIAAMLGKSSASTRQLAHRARARVEADRPRFDASPEERRRLTERFLAAARDGDIHALTATLAADVTSWADGGADTLAARRPVTGRDNISRYVLGGMRKIFADTQATVEEVNGETAILLWRGSELVNVTALSIAGGQIQAFHAVVNPHKLAYIQRRVMPPGVVSNE